MQSRYDLPPFGTCSHACTKGTRPHDPHDPQNAVQAPLLSAVTHIGTAQPSQGRPRLRRHDQHSKRSPIATERPHKRSRLRDTCARLLGLAESQWCRAARRAHAGDPCAHGRALAHDWHSHATRNHAVSATAAATFEHVHVAKVSLNSKGASFRPFSTSTATLLAAEATASKSAGGLREEMGT